MRGRKTNTVAKSVAPVSNRSAASPSDGEVAWLRVIGARQNNLRDITVEVPNGGAPVYTSPVLNPNNSLNGPSVITLDLGSTYTGNVLTVSRDPTSNINKDQGILSLAEVEIGVLGDVMLPSGTNLTHAGIVAMTADQSTNGYGSTADRAFDGLTNWPHATHTARRAQAVVTAAGISVARISPAIVLAGSEIDGTSRAGKRRGVVR